MLSREPVPRKPEWERTSAILLVAGALAGVVVMAFHPTAHGLMTPGAFERQAQLNAAVHGLAIASIPVVFLGLIGLSRNLGWSLPVTGALVAWGFGGVAVLCAAVASGFLAPDMIAGMLHEQGTTRDVYEALLDYTGHFNQAFARIQVVACSAAILLWSAEMRRVTRFGNAVAIFGIVSAAATLAGLFAGHLRMDVHGFGIVVLAESAWLIWVAMRLRRAGPTPPA